MHKSAKAISISRKGPKPGIFDTNLINGIHMWKEEICRWKGERFVILKNVVMRES